MEIGQKIRKMRKARNWTLEELANKIGSDTGNLSRFERGIQGYSQEFLKKLANAFDVSVASLFESEIKNEPPKGYVPLISWVTAGRLEEIQEFYSTIDAEKWLPCPVKHGNRTFALHIRGDSMYNPSAERSFKNGDIIFVDPDKAAIHGSFVVVRRECEHDATFKRLIDDGNKKMLEAINPSWPNRIFELDDETQICGVAIAKMESFYEI